jgi:hypothetical protein
MTDETQQSPPSEPLTVADLIRDARDEFQIPSLDNFLIGWLSSHAGVEATTKAIAAYRNLHAGMRDSGAKS